LADTRSYRFLRLAVDETWIRSHFHVEGFLLERHENKRDLLPGWYMLTKIEFQ
jgi:hypothetical protein